MVYRYDIAILFFSRSPHGDASNKHWGNLIQSFQKIQIAQQLTLRTQKVLNTLPLPVFHFDEVRQIGDTFGDRLANAYQSLFDLGYKSVIAVGNDCIDLHKVHWSAVIDRLEQGHAIIGPDHRNGSYLIGCTHEQFNKNTFAKLPWQTDALITELKNMLCGADILPELADFNEQEDLHYLLHIKHPSIKFIKLLFSILKSTLLEKSTLNSKILLQQFLLSQHSLRAPPKFAKAF